MTTEFLSLAGMTTADRHRVTAEIGDAVSGTGGWIMNHTLSSNIALAIRCSIPSHRLGDFRDRVIAAGVKLDDASLAGLQALIGKPGAAAAADISTTLNVTFIHDEPDLRRIIPAVPG